MRKQVNPYEVEGEIEQIRTTKKDNDRKISHRHKSHCTIYKLQSCHEQVKEEGKKERKKGNISQS